jgi:arsenate reductase
VEPIRILFLCIGNMCRSPMAEAIARTLGGGHIEALSAGLSPAGRVDPNTLDALAELGYPTEGLHSKPVTAVDLHDLDVIVSLIGESGLAVLPRNLSAQRVAWSIHDPLGEDLEAFVATAELLERRVRALVEELLRGA